MCHSYGACSSGVERQIVDLVVEGSNPFGHPKNPFNAFVAQPDRATDFESVGRTFESCRTQRKTAVSKDGYARAISSAGRATDS